MPVDTKHKEYTANQNKWSLVRDCVAGQEAIKAKKQAYLPIPNPTDKSPENIARYDQYLERAMFLNITARTKNGLVGAVFRRDPSLSLPSAIEELQENVDGAGQSVIQMSKWCIGELLTTGRVGLFVDYPTVEAQPNVAQSRAMGLRPNVLQYQAEAIINWRYGLVNGAQKLTMVVLREWVDVSTDEFDTDMKAQYRVLKMDEAGNYTMRLFNEKREAITGITYPRRGDGSNWKEIPFVVIGSENSMQGIDDAPLYPLAVVNIGHYRNSADYEEAVFMHGQGTLFVDVGQMTLDDFTKKNPEGILVGARKGHILGAGGNAILLQMEANSSAFEAMESKESQMIAIGARIITKGGSAKTAEEIKVTSSTESSVLDDVVGNTSEGIEQALEFATVFMNGDPDEVLFSLNREYFGGQYDPQAAMAKMQELDRGLIAKKDYRDWLRGNGGINPDRDDEVIDEEVENQPGMPDLEGEF